MKHISKIILVAVCLMFTATTLMSTGMATECVILKEKNPTTWEVVPGGSYGTFTYGFISTSWKFGFAGYDLAPYTQYTLISYKEPWAGTGSVVLATGTSSMFGMLSLRGTLPPLAYNTYTTGEYAGQTGAKIWLVLASDFQNGHFVAWHPTEYLFETRLITN